MPKVEQRHLDAAAWWCPMPDKPHEHLNAVTHLAAMRRGYAAGLAAEEATHAAAQKERERVLFLSIVRGACLSDHMGDMWNDLIEIAKMLGIELPEDEEDEISGISLEGIEEMGGRGVWTDPKLADYLCDHEWTDLTNEVIQSGQLCRKCNAVR